MKRIQGCDGELVTYCHIRPRKVLCKTRQKLTVLSCSYLEELTVNKAILSPAILHADLSAS